MSHWPAGAVCNSYSANELGPSCNIQVTARQKFVIYSKPFPIILSFYFESAEDYYFGTKSKKKVKLSP
jgi:hypothetical protein